MRHMLALAALTALVPLGGCAHKSDARADRGQLRAERADPPPPLRDLEVPPMTHDEAVDELPPTPPTPPLPPPR